MGSTVIRIRRPARHVGQSYAAELAKVHRAAFCATNGTRHPALPVYILDRPNRCPDCHGEAFAVGRITAECAGCGLPMVIVSLRRPS